MPSKKADDRHTVSQGLSVRIRLWIGIIVTLILTILIVVIQLGQTALGNRQWQAASLFPFSNGEAKSRLASDLLGAGEKEAAQRMAMDALGKSIAHVEALRSAGIILFDKGETRRGRSLVELASDLSWRDSPTQAWLFEKALVSGEYSQAILHADALLRRNRARDEIFGIFTLAALQPELVEPLRLQFAKNPPWRENFFRQAQNTADDQIRGFENIANALKGSAAPAQPEEIRPFATMLITRGETRRALQLWANLFPADSAVLTRGGKLALQWPPSERLDRPYPIDWRFRSSRLIFPSIINNGIENPSILDLELDRKALGEIARRPVTVPTGKALLSLTGDVPDISDLRKLRWYLQCSDGDSPRQAPEIQFLPTGDDKVSWQADIVEPCDVHDLVLAIKLGGLSDQTRLTLDSVALTHIANSRS